MTLDSAGLIQWSPTVPQLGLHTIAVRFHSPTGSSEDHNFTISVRPVVANTSPKIISRPISLATTGRLYRYDLVAQDPDHDALAYELLSAPAGMSIQPSTGSIRWQPAQDQLGSSTVTIQVSDPQGGSTTQIFSLTTFVVFVSAVDNVGISQLELKVNDRVVALDANHVARLYADDWGFGTLNMVATARDAAGNVGWGSGVSFYRNPDVDYEANPAVPTAIVTSPAIDESVVGMVRIEGTAAGPDFKEYRLLYARADNLDFIEFAHATTQVQAGLLGTWDTTLLENDAYIVRLEVTDLIGSTSVVDVPVGLSGALKLGNFRLSFEDMTIPVAGIPITIVRTYDTLRADRQGDFGYGWRLEYRDTDLRTSLPRSGLEDIGIYTPFKQGTKVYLTLPGGERQGFTFTPEYRVLPGFGQGNDLVIAFPRFTPDRGVSSTLTAGSGSLLVNEFGEMYTAGGIPWNPASPDLSGYTLTTPDGVRYQIDGATGLMNRVTDRNANSIQFSASGISSSTGVAISIERDLKGRIQAITDPSGNNMSYKYSTVGDLLSVTDRNGNTTTFEYKVDSVHYLDRIIDPLGRTGIRTQYDSDGRLIGTLALDGNPTSLAYSPENQLVTSVNAAGQQTTYVYDMQGNVVSETDALGRTTLHTFDSNNRETSQTDPAGNTLYYSYDASGNEIERKDPLGHSTHYSYESFGKLASQTNALGETWTYQYDARGNQIAFVDPLGFMTQMEYDSTGAETAIIDAAGNRTSYEYSGGKKVKVIAPDGTQTMIVVDDLGNTQSIRKNVTTPAGIRELTMSATYDANGQALTWTDAEQNLTTQTWTATGQSSSLTDALGRTTVTLRDDLDRTVGINFADGAVIQLVNNSMGQVTEQTLPGQQVIKNVYDAIGRPTALIYPDSTSGDASDNPKLQISYDVAGRPTTTTDPNGRVTQKEFDAYGNVTAVIDPSGNRVTNEFDAANRLIQTSDTLGHTTRYQYDANGRLTRTTLPNGASVAVAYDSRGNITSLVDALGNQTKYTYDTTNRLIGVLDAAGGQTIYGYDEVGNLVRETDANGNVTTFEYDGRGLRTAIVRPMGERETYVYDAVGQLVKYTNAAGESVVYQYDLRGRLASKAVDGNTTTFTYDAAENLSSVSDVRGVTLFEYDARGHITKKTEPDGRFIEYTYDAFGNMQSISTESGATTYRLDAAGRLDNVIDQGGGVTVYHYDVMGRLSQMDRPDGTTELRDYDAIGNVVRILTSAPSQVISDLQYTYDLAGRVIKLENVGISRQEFKYDVLGRLVQESTILNSGDSTRIDYEYDRVGNRLSMSDGRGTTTYTYDRDDRLLQTTGEQAATYTYDAASRLISINAGPNDQKQFEWSGEHRLVRSKVVISTGTSTTDYVYDHNGDLVETNRDGVQLKLLVDSNRPYAEVIEESSAGGAVLASYAFGYDRLSRTTPSGATYYHTDRLGSTLYITDSAHHVVGSQWFSGYGIETAGEGDSNDPYLFTGQRRDQTTGLDYLRARYYDSVTGRFISPDPFLGKLEDPISRHRFAYAADDPTNAVDPSGMFTLSELMTTDYLRNTLMVGLAQLSFSAIARGVGGSVQWDGPTLMFSAGDFSFGGGVYTSDKNGPTYSTVPTLILAESASFNGLQYLIKKVSSAPLPPLSKTYYAAAANASINLLLGGAFQAAGGLAGLGADVSLGSATLYSPALFGRGQSSPINFLGGYLSVGVGLGTGLLGLTLAVDLYGWTGKNALGLSVTSQAFAHGWSIPDLSLSLAGNLGGQISVGLSLPIPIPSLINLPSDGGKSP